MSNPGAAGCLVVLPPSQSQQGSALAQALNTTINVINAVSITAGGGSPTSGGSSGPSAASSTPDDSGIKDKGEKEENVVAQNTGTKKEEPKKTFCN